jgi:hypothetical protein
MSHPLRGDGGIAIFDAVDYAVNLIQQEAGAFRRIVLLLSEPQDEGSQTSAKDLIRHLGESNTSVYSLTFLPTNRPSPYFGSKSHALEAPDSSHRQAPKHSGDVRGSTPLDVALRAMQKNAAEEISNLSGGAHLKFRNETEIGERLSAITDDIRNRRTLSFQPNSHQQGFHTLAVQLEPPTQHVDIVARTSYWYEASNR